MGNSQLQLRMPGEAAPFSEELRSGLQKALGWQDGVLEVGRSTLRRRGSTVAGWVRRAERHLVAGRVGKRTGLWRLGSGSLFVAMVGFLWAVWDWGHAVGGVRAEIQSACPSGRSRTGKFVRLPPLAGFELADWP